MNRLLRNALMLTAALGLLVSTALAQGDYPWQPDRPINIIVPWAAGGSTDQVTRVMAAELEKELGTSVVVVNQPGASGSVGTTNVLNADKDGYTWAAGAVRDLGTYAVLDMLDTNVEDWHLYFGVSNTGVIAVNPDTPYQTFDELLAAFEANPGQIPVATAGLSSAGHTVMEAIAAATGIEYRHVPYDGGNPAVIATVAGEADVVTQLAVEEAEMLRAGRLRALAAYSEQPLTLEGVGEIPAITDWLPDLRIPTNYFGLWAPKGIPEEVVQTMDMVWEDVMENSEALRTYAAERGALFDPMYGEEALAAAIPSVAHQAWTLYDGGKAPIDPSTLGIERP
ncbi:MAG TPA: tripartite tricarboxylate transporter substrate binding protein [Trueperaceae bacterium]|nr:tripartite tricarboxylate transporter substrate binding protein [Trueperaceae bacterium]